MTTLYRPVLIESAEQAEALPVGTISIDLDSQGQPRQASIRVRCGWYCTGEATADGSPWLAPHDAMAGDTALVPVEAEEVWGSQDKSGGISRAHAGAEDPHATVKLHIAERTALGHPDRLVSHYVTPWEEVAS